LGAAIDVPEFNVSPPGTLLGHLETVGVDVHVGAEGGERRFLAGLVDRADGEYVGRSMPEG